MAHCTQLTTETYSVMASLHLMCRLCIQYNTIACKRTSIMLSNSEQKDLLMVLRVSLQSQHYSWLQAKCSIKQLPPTRINRGNTLNEQHNTHLPTIEQTFLSSKLFFATVHDERQWQKMLFQLAIEGGSAAKGKSV